MLLWVFTALIVVTVAGIATYQATNSLIIVGIIVAIIGGFFLFFATKMLIARIENIRALLADFFDFLNRK